MKNAIMTVPTRPVLEKIDKGSTGLVTGMTLIQQLFEQHVALPMMQDSVFLQALQRSTNELNDASPQQMADYLAGMDDAQLQGLANNVRGIYHELKYVDTFNSSHSTLSAEVFGATNHPGSDVEISDRDTGQVVSAIQLKATDSASYIRDHAERYPEITVLATEEVAEKMDDVESSGFTNAELKDSVLRGMTQLEEASLSDQVGDAIGLSAFASGLVQISQVISGKKTMEHAAHDGLRDVGIASASSALVALLLG